MLEWTTDKWTKNDEKMQENIQILLQLQREHLQMEKEQLAFQREMSGYPEKKKCKQSKRGVHMMLF